MLKVSKDPPTSDRSAAGEKLRLPERIETPRLVVRLWAIADVGAMHDAVTASTEHLRPWMPWIAAEPLTVVDRRGLVAQWLDEWNAGGDAVYGIFTRPEGETGPTADPQVVGGTGLHRRIGEGGLEIGYWIHVEHLRLGYAREAAAALTSAALEQPGIDRVEIRHDTANEASGLIPKSLGYRMIREEEQQPQAPAEVGITRIWQNP